MPLPRLPRTVIVLSLVSFFNDLASEMVVPLIPILLATVLAAGPVALGLVEGVADAVASLLKLWSGRRSDLLGGRRKGLALAGYALSNSVRPLLGIAGSWPVLLALRSLDRVGKGLRSAPRDALVADATPPEIRGLAFGFHRAMDNAGAVGGSLIAAAVLAWSGMSLTQVILWSALPGAMGVLLIAFGVGEKPRPVTPAPAPQISSLPWSTLAVPLQRYLLVLMLFTFARASETFIVLRGHELGMSVVELLLLWAALNLAKALTSTRGGVLADKLGKEPLILFGWAAFGVAFMLLGWVAHSSWLWVVAILYGLTTGLAEGPERALISDFAGAETRGTAFGWYHLMTGLAAIPAGLAFGLIWQLQSAEWAFRYAGILALVAALLMHFLGVARTFERKSMKFMILFIALSAALALVWMRSSQAAAMPQAGQPAPDFSLVDQNGKLQKLADYRGKWLVLYFYPKDETPACTTEACAFRDDILKIRKLNAEVVGVSIDDASRHAEFAKKHGLPFPLLADKDGIVAARYGSVTNLIVMKLAKRNTFIIDPQGRIAKVYAGADAGRNSEQVIADLPKLEAARPGSR